MSLALTQPADGLVLPLAQEIVNGSLMYVEAMIISLLFLGIVAWVGKTMSTDTDRSWLSRYVVWGYMAKLAGAFARFWMVTVLYQSGDATDYHLAGEAFAPIWRGLVVPVSDAGGDGTAFTEVATGFFYAIYTPSFLGGFIIFATLSFFGQLLFLSAFRRWFGPEKQKLYAVAILFYPSLLFWPASIGKDALMVLFLGVATYGASRLLATYKITSIVFIGAGLLLAAGIRPHVAGMLAISLVLAIVLGKPLPHLRGSPMRPVLLVGALLAASVVLATFSTTFEVGLERTRTTTDVGGFLEEVSGRTGTGGSEFEGVAVSTPSQLPLAILTVLFRPLLHEGANAQMIVSALEGTVLLGFVILRLPQIWRNKGLLRRKAYMTMCFFYTGGFIIGFSAINNLGILARQRVQVIPMFLALVVALAWPEPTDEPDDGGAEEDPETEDAARAVQPSARELNTPTVTRRGRHQAAVELPNAGTPLEGESGTEPADVEGDEEVPEIANAPPSDDERETRPRRNDKSRRPRVRDRIRSDVVALYRSDPDLPIREIAVRVSASPSSVRRVLIEEGLRQAEK